MTAAAAFVSASSPFNIFAWCSLLPAELFGVVTHKGRDSSSGHYIAWVRKSHGGKEWLLFDDDSVTETDTETVTTRLKGGGDEHMAYMLFYRAV